MTLHNKRPGIAMIELIFALVIMAIALMSAPMLINTSTKSSMVALQQESIAAAVTQMSTIMATEWDHWDTNDTIGEPVLETNRTTFGQCASGDKPAGVTSNSGRYCIGLDGSGSYAATPTSDFGIDGTLKELNGYDDVDDYHAKRYHVNVYANETTTPDKGDYIDKNITMYSEVFYADDTPSTGTYGTSTAFSNPFQTKVITETTNIKMIYLKLTSNNEVTELSNKEVGLSAFMCNIGAPKPNIISNWGTLQ